MKLIQLLSFQTVDKIPCKSIDFKGLQMLNETNNDTFFPSSKEMEPLDQNSISANFFGVNNPNSIGQKIMNHLILAFEKEKDGLFVNSKRNYVVDEDIDFATSWQNFFDYEKDFIEKLKQNGAIRFTLSSKLFAQDDKWGTHTIGLVYDKKTNALLILDSLNDDSFTVQIYKIILRELFLNLKARGDFSKVIFSTKPQQKNSEYTCNNWAIANIEAVKKELKKGRNITNANELNDILPSNINAVLEKQYEFVLNRKDNFAGLF